MCRATGLCGPILCNRSTDERVSVAETRGCFGTSVPTTRQGKTPWPGTPPPPRARTPPHSVRRWLNSGEHCAGLKRLRDTGTPRLSCRAATQPVADAISHGVGGKPPGVPCRRQVEPQFSPSSAFCVYCGRSSAQPAMYSTGGRWGSYDHESTKKPSFHAMQKEGQVWRVNKVRTFPLGCWISGISTQTYLRPPPVSMIVCLVG